jgi:hypothetical protein
MHPQRRRMAWINLLGGIAVLGSYAQGFLSHPAISGELWGEVPQALRPLYVLSMFTAAAGYLAFTAFLFLRVDPDQARVAGRYDLGLFNWLYLVILIPSALWMPLTFQMLDSPGPTLWLLIRLVLWSVGLGSLALVVALWRLRPRQPARLYWLAVLGSVAFTVQTGLLDALVWVIYYPA